MTAELTTKEVAETLGIPLGTLKGWLNKIPVPMSVDSSGSRRIGSEGIEVIKQIQTLRLDEGRGMETIRRRLTPDSLNGSQTDPGSPSMRPGDPVDSPDEAETHLGSMIDTSLIVAQVVEAIASNTDLAVRYSQATYQIGKLEAERDFYKAQLEEARQEMALLKAPPHGRHPWWKFLSNRK